MGRLMGILVGLFAVLTIIWFCCGNGIPRAFAGQDSKLPQFFSEPEETEKTPEEYPELEIGELTSYSGNILDDTLQGVAALQLQNVSQTVIVQAEVKVCQDSRELYFVAGYIPPGGTVLVEEKNRKTYTDAPVTDTRCITLTILEEREVSAVSVETDGRGYLLVTNLTQQPLGCVRVYYKPYDPLQDMYIGSVTYCVVMPQLRTGESRQVWLYCYDEDRARVVAVVVEDKKAVIPLG